ncbi:MAG: DUF4440 domain-containing protein [Propionibacteriaceae bacterium]|jgi:ribonuclease HI|nr:DUF4440 domain-containing protein [Propionibacteriaceae bacterium]
MIIAAADGSSLSNPGPSGWAWYIDDDRWACGGWELGTNNRGELMAVLDLLRQTRQVDDSLRICCDSQYVINVCTKWRLGWKRKGWRKADGKEILNLDLIQALDEELTGREVGFEWVKGHAGHPLNEEADTLARGVATALKEGRSFDPGPGLNGAGASTSTMRATSTLSSGNASNRSAGHPAEPQPLFGLTLEPRSTVPTSPQAPPPARRESPHQPALVGADDSELSSLTRDLVSDETHLDRARLEALLHRDFVAHLPGGVIRTRGSILARPAELHGPAHFDIVGVDHPAPRVALVRFTLDYGAERFLAAVLWQRDETWQARFEQLTPANA